jgi:hypothetical protein|tara:strand:- start:501 stop:863 length:363 start_codon:yes stop_codon:yes gene_type:complete
MLTRQPIRPKCSSCIISYAKPNGISKGGFQKWHKYCVSCAKALYNKKITHLKYKTTTCVECGFVPEDLIQLDIAYKDLNPQNKSKNNIVTVCANCNRLRRKKIREGNKQLEMSVDSTIRI